MVDLCSILILYIKTSNYLKIFIKGYKHFNAIWSKAPEGVVSELNAHTNNKESPTNGLGWYWRQPQTNIEAIHDTNEPPQNIVAQLIG